MIYDKDISLSLCYYSKDFMQLFQIHAVGTISRKVMPAFLTKDRVLYEIGATFIPGTNCPRYFELSPDGIIR